MLRSLFDPPYHHLAIVIVLLIVGSAHGQLSESELPRLTLPSCEEELQAVVPLPQSIDVEATAAFQLEELDAADSPRLPTNRVPLIGTDGSLVHPRGAIVLRIPASDSKEEQRQFLLRSVNPSDCSAVEMDAEFKWDPPTENSVHLSQKGEPVLTYNFGPVTEESVPERDHRRVRGCYVHPLWGLQGEQLTADFPRDHFHHHGLFWAWKHIIVGDREYDLWEYPNIEDRFVRWLCRETGPETATLGVENGWFVDGGQIMVERFWMRVYPAGEDSRAIDLQLTLIPTDQPVSLSGDEGKSYGGMTLRFDVWPRRDAVIRTPDRTIRHVGSGLESAEDLSNTALPWADLASEFAVRTGRSGAALLIHPQHPDYPPTWLTRCYGPLCVGWPGTEPQTLQPGVPVTLRYRLWIHRQEVEHSVLQRVYQCYVASCRANWVSSP